MQVVRVTHVIHDLVHMTMLASKEEIPAHGTVLGIELIHVAEEIPAHGTVLGIELVHVEPLALTPDNPILVAETMAKS